MTKPEGTIRTNTDGTIQKKQGKKWVYIGCVPKPKPVFPPITLPDHIRPTKYPHYYVSNDGVAYREPRPRDASGCHGEINQWGLIEMKTQLRGNPYDKSKMYEGLNIYFYDEDGKNIGQKKRNIHQLVAETWIPNPHGYNEVLHGEKGNRCNHYTNLRWGTHKENMKEAKSAAPEGTQRRTHGKLGSLYEKRDGEWVLVPSNKPAWNKGLKGISWNTLPDGTVRMRRVNDGYGKFIKQNGEWVYQKTGNQRSAPDGTIRTDKDGRKRTKIDGKWVYQKKERVAEVFENDSYVTLKVKGLYPDGSITKRSDGTKWKKENGKWVYQKKLKKD